LVNHLAEAVKVFFRGQFWEIQHDQIGSRFSNLLLEEWPQTLSACVAVQVDVRNSPAAIDNGEIGLSPPAFPPPSKHLLFFEKRCCSD